MYILTLHFQREEIQMEEHGLGYVATVDGTSSSKGKPNSVSPIITSKADLKEGVSN